MKLIFKKGQMAVFSDYSRSLEETQQQCHHHHYWKQRVTETGESKQWRSHHSLVRRAVSAMQSLAALSTAHCVKTNLLWWSHSWWLPFLCWSFLKTFLVKKFISWKNLVPLTQPKCSFPIPSPIILRLLLSLCTRQTIGALHNLALPGRPRTLFSRPDLTLNHNVSISKTLLIYWNTDFGTGHSYTLQHVTPVIIATRRSSTLQLDQHEWNHLHVQLNDSCCGNKPLG